VSAYVRSSEIVERLKLRLPVEVTLPDAWTGEPFTVRRDNYLAILTIDTHNLLFEGQALSPLMAEAGRAARAAQYQAELAEIRYRKWKAQRGAELRENLKKANEKAPTKDAVETFYRSHDDYEKMASEPKKYEALAGLFSDLRNAFHVKSKIEHDQAYLTGTYESVERADAQFDRLREIETLEEEAEAVLAASGSAAVAAAYAQNEDKPKPRQAREL
jgi:hypothetical protein